nr:MAG TPA: hypothetical protein [Caudoviricetes sp.]
MDYEIIACDFINQFVNFVFAVINIHNMYHLSL